MSEQTIPLHRFAGSSPPRSRHIRKHIFYGNILIWNTGFGRGSINTHQQQRWPCEDMGLSRVDQQNNRAGNRWSIFNIRMKIIKMFTMEINIQLWENQYLEEEQNSNGQSWRYCCGEPVVRLNSLEHSLGTDCNWSSIITEGRTSALNLKYSLQFNISFCPRLSHSLSLFVLIKFLC